ncbi:EsaB/YukD family protein [Streptomyces sp. NPDC048527]|uniref:EsaB/YukD family protein n=1 Tax=Streptomyces sp. NPDC048527 TaxID=3365568 RepID=UPI003710071C
MDEHCRITVVGDHRTMDLAVPAGAPIVTYADTLARLCDQETPDIMPSAWTLAATVGAPFAPEWSLAELGIVDGHTLYLCDVLSGEFADPVVHDVAERVTEVATGALDRRWDAASRTYTVVALALGWIVTVLLVLAARHQVDKGSLGGISLGTGLLLPIVAWVAMEREWSVPAPLRMAVGLCAVPVLSLSAWALATGPGAQAIGARESMTQAGLAVSALAVGALLGAYLAFVAAPTVTTCALLLAALVVASLCVALAVLRADGTQAASVAAVAAFGLLTVAPPTVSRTVAFAHRRIALRAQTEPGDDEVAGAVRAATGLLVVWSGGLALVLALSLVTMAASTSPYANAAAGVLGAALLLRAGAARLTAEVVPVLLAGVAGLLTLLLAGPPHFGWGYWVAPTYSCLLGAVLLLYGFRRLMRRTAPRPMERPRYLTMIGSALAGGSVALVVAAFGAFGTLAGLGQRL